MPIKKSNKTVSVSVKKPAPKVIKVATSDGVSADGGIMIAGSRERVWISLGLKINRGHYQSLDISLGLSRDVVAGDETSEEAFDSIYNLASSQLDEKAGAILEMYPIEKD